MTYLICTYFFGYYKNMDITKILVCKNVYVKIFDITYERTNFDQYEMIFSIKSGWFPVLYCLVSKKKWSIQNIVYVQIWTRSPSTCQIKYGTMDFKQNGGIRGMRINSKKKICIKKKKKKWRTVDVWRDTTTKIIYESVILLLKNVLLLRTRWRYTRNTRAHSHILLT